MATITISRPSSPARDLNAGTVTTTPGSDFLNGSGATEVLGRALTATEQTLFDGMRAAGATRNAALDLIFLNLAEPIYVQLGGPAQVLDAEVFDILADRDVTRTLDANEIQIYRLAFNPAFTARFGLPAATTARQALTYVEPILGAFGVAGSGPYDPEPLVDVFGGPYSADFTGDDRLYGNGGDDYIVDLLGNNLVTTDDGDDRILLGAGNDRIYDRGGDNDIDILGGDNSVTTGDGEDRIDTGAGRDNINAFDGRNFIKAGDGANTVRGGEDYDEVFVGVGNDFVEVRFGGLVEDAAGKLVLGPDGAPLEDTVDWTLPFVGTVAAHNFVQDMGGSDSIRATGSSRSDRPGFPDRTFNGDDVVLSDFGFNGSNFQVLGNDRIELGGGDNVVLDLGGNDVVRTLEGSDTVLTSILAPGNDDISVGGGDDVVNPGGGNDTVRGGAGQDDIILENDGFADRLVYLTGDVSLSPATTDVITGFDYAGGLDKIDVRGLGLTASMRRLFVSPIDAEGDGLRDILIGWDTNPADTAINFYTTIVSDAFSPTGALLLTNANFIYADAIV